MKLLFDLFKLVKWQIRIVLPSNLSAQEMVDPGPNFSRSWLPLSGIPGNIQFLVLRKFHHLNSQEDLKDVHP